MPRVTTASGSLRTPSCPVRRTTVSSGKLMPPLARIDEGRKGFWGSWPGRCA
jgi:hypothetical protein